MFKQVWHKYMIILRFLKHIQFNKIAIEMILKHTKVKEEKAHFLSLTAYTCIYKVYT